MNKVARIRIPAEKVEAISEVWPDLFMNTNGPWTAQVYEDDEAFMANEQIMRIEGDSEVINPIVTRIMLIVTT